MSFIELAVVDLNNVRHNDQLEESGENVSPEVGSSQKKHQESPEKLGRRGTSARR
jgi:hypothetical protein